MSDSKKLSILLGVTAFILFVYNNTTDGDWPRVLSLAFFTVLFGVLSMYFWNER